MFFNFSATRVFSLYSDNSVNLGDKPPKPSERGS